MVLGCLPSMYLTSMLVRTQGQEENCLEGQKLQGSLSLVQNEPCQLVQKPGRGSRRGFPSGLWVCLSGSYPGDVVRFSNFQAISNG